MTARISFSTRLAAAVLAVAALVGAPRVTEAVPVTCPGTSSWFDREFTLTTAMPAVCVNSGIGDFETSAQGEASYLAGGWSLIDKTGSSGGVLEGALSLSGLELLGSAGGLFSIHSAVWDLFSEVILVIEASSQWIDFNPDWAVFSLASNTTGGAWLVTPGVNISMNIYGKGASTPVPEPAPIVLLAAGLGGLLLFRRRRALLAATLRA